MTPTTPQLPQGESSIFSTLSQSLSFHSSPESFISARIQGSPTLREHLNTTAGATRKVARARILNRNVAVVTSYQHCKDILHAENGASQSTAFKADSREKVDARTFAVRPAYEELMSQFFPAPNLLLEDYPGHAAQRAQWDEQLSTFPADVAPLIRDIASEHIESLGHGSQIELYDTMKDLSWKILIGVFLNLDHTSKTFSTVESLQETLLRGQFSLFPVAVNSRFWRSPRSQGIEARQQLQSLLKQHIHSQRAETCPLLRHMNVDKDSIASNVLLFTSSIAVKALSSLLTASLLNLFLYPSGTLSPLTTRIRNASSPSDAEALLRSVLLETERLSPPVVGVMRRVQEDIVLANPAPTEHGFDSKSSPHSTSPTGIDTLVPAGWDVWLYFSGAARDPSVFPQAEIFIPDRFVSSFSPNPPSTTDTTSPSSPAPHPFPSSLAFGSGAKACLAAPLIHDIIYAVARTMLDKGVRLEGNVKAKGVRGWLGWEAGVGPEEFARDLKQLPCQRPKEGVKVRVWRNGPLFQR